MDENHRDPHSDKREVVHVTELPPGHVVLSRERLREAIAKAMWENKSRDVDQICEAALERELFGETNER